jgi:hypothetical protein
LYFKIDLRQFIATVWNVVRQTTSENKALQMEDAFRVSCELLDMEHSYWINAEKNLFEQQTKLERMVA